MAKYQFISLNSGKVLDDLSLELKNFDWENFHPENLEYNHLNNIINKPDERPIISDYLPFKHKMKWLEETRICYIQTEPIIEKVSYDDFLKSALTFFEKFKNKKIAVQLSGGLDSSIIICLLKYFNIPFTLIGMFSDRYEFRTEKIIQNKLAEFTTSNKLIDFENNLPFSNLSKIPDFNYPDLSCINYSADKAMAEACASFNIDFLFSGEGGDFVFSHEINSEETKYPWSPTEFYDNWLNENIYNKVGCELVPFYGDEKIMNCIFNLRRGEKEDWSKKWARNYFKDLLPKELVTYSYYADFWGIYCKGILNTIEEMQNLISTAYAISKNQFFAPENFKAMFSKNILNLDRSTYSKIEAKVAAAAWVNSNFTKHQR